MKQEIKTIRIMIQLYCRAHHDSHSNLCPECLDLFDYAEQQIKDCPFGVSKPVCNRCPIHCYSSDYQKKIRSVMRHSGPQMFFRHPILSIRHLLHSYFFNLGGRSK